MTFANNLFRALEEYDGLIARRDADDLRIRGLQSENRYLHRCVTQNAVFTDNLLDELAECVEENFQLRRDINVLRVPYRRPELFVLPGGGQPDDTEAVQRERDAVGRCRELEAEVVALRSKIQTLEAERDLARAERNDARAISSGMAP